MAMPAPACLAPPWCACGALVLWALAKGEGGWAMPPGMKGTAVARRVLLALAELPKEDAGDRPALWEDLRWPFGRLPEDERGAGTKAGACMLVDCIWGWGWGPECTGRGPWGV